jgi:hypothetical protein
MFDGALTVRSFVLASFALVVSSQSSVGLVDERKIDKSGEFSYVLPEGWKTIAAAKVAHDLVLLPAEDGLNRNVVINDHKGDGSLKALKQQYERDFPKALKEFQLVRSEMLLLKGKGQALRLIHTNTAPGVPVRQVNYVVDLGGKRYFVALTVAKDDGDQYDEALRAFVTSMTQAEAKGR